MTNYGKFSLWCSEEVRAFYYRPGIIEAGCGCVVEVHKRRKKKPQEVSWLRTCPHLQPEFEEFCDRCRETEYEPDPEDFALEHVMRWARHRVMDYRQWLVDKYGVDLKGEDLSDGEH